MNTYTKKRNEYYKNFRKKKKKRLPPAVLLIPLCAALAVCIALAVYLHRGQGSGAEKYYRDNSKLIDVISLEDSNATRTEMQVMFDLAVRGFAPQFDNDGNRIGYPVTYHYAPDGGYVEEAEVSIISTDKHPMYQTFYVSGDTEENRISWVIDIINGEVFARPVSFLLETTCDKEILLTEDKEGKVTSYCDGTFYITVPYETAATTVIVDKINAETLDGITFNTLSALTGATRLASAEISGGEGKLAAASSADDRKSSVLSASAAKADSDDTVIVVSLGDSFSSGEGIPPFYGQKGKTLAQKVEDEDWLAHRSTKSWPSLLEILGVDGALSNYRVEPGTVSTAAVQWYFAAVSGAETKHIDQENQIKNYFKFFGPADSQLMPLQIDIFDGINGKKVDFVTLTIGGNDVDFAEIIAKCAVETSYLHLGALSSLEKKLNKLWDNIDITMATLRRVYGAVAARAPYAAILVAGYPELLDENWGWIDFNPQEARLVNSAVSAFNAKIKELVNECWKSGMNIYFVDVETKFHGHQAYAKNESGEDIA